MTPLQYSKCSDKPTIICLRLENVYQTQSNHSPKFATHFHRKIKNMCKIHTVKSTCLIFSSKYFFSSSGPGFKAYIVPYGVTCRHYIIQSTCYDFSSALPESRCASRWGVFYWLLFIIIILFLLSPPSLYLHSLYRTLCKPLCSWTYCYAFTVTTLTIPTLD